MAPKFPSIQYEEMIVDNTCMQLVSKPHQFDVMVSHVLRARAQAEPCPAAGLAVVPARSATHSTTSVVVSH